MTVRASLCLDTPDGWAEAFQDFFFGRLRFRYLDPIELLQKQGSWGGEGFSILAIQCSLIEFLEATRLGKRYRYCRHDDELGPYEYKSSKKMFVSFLSSNAPFSCIFNEESAEAFYTNVRCGLLHEAATKGGWLIWAEEPSGAIANVKGKIVYRDNLQQALLKYIDGYGQALPNDRDLKEAFIRKLDSICEQTKDA